MIIPASERADLLGPQALAAHPDQLAVKITGLLLVVMCPVRDKRHDRALPSRQPCRHVTVVIEAHAADIPCPDDVGPLFAGHPHVWPVHGACLLPDHYGTPRTRGTAHQQLGGPLVVVWDNLNIHVSAAMTELIAPGCG
jgi:hypothetical protein